MNKLNRRSHKTLNKMNIMKKFSNIKKLIAMKKFIIFYIINYLMIYYCILPFDLPQKEINYEIDTILKQLKNLKKIHKNKIAEIHDCFLYIQQNLEKNNLILKVNSLCESIHGKNLNRKKQLQKLVLSLNKILSSYPYGAEKDIKKLSFHYFLQTDNLKKEKNNILIANKIKTLLDEFYLKIPNNVLVSIADIKNLLIELKLGLIQVIPDYLFFTNIPKKDYIREIPKNQQKHELIYNIVETLDDSVNLKAFINTFFMNSPIAQTNKVFIKKFIYKDYFFILLKQKLINSYVPQVNAVYFNLVDKAKTSSTQTKEIEIKKILNDSLDNHIELFYRLMLSRLVFFETIDQICYSSSLDEKYIRVFRSFSQEERKTLHHIFKSIKKI